MESREPPVRRTFFLKDKLEAKSQEWTEAVYYYTPGPRIRQAIEMRCAICCCH